MVPGRFAVVAIVKRSFCDGRHARHQGRTLCRRKSGHAVAETQITREESIQPRALFGCEWRAVGQQLRDRRWESLAHERSLAANAGALPPPLRVGEGGRSELRQWRVKR